MLMASAVGFLVFVMAFAGEDMNIPVLVHVVHKAVSVGDMAAPAGAIFQWLWVACAFG